LEDLRLIDHEFIQDKWRQLFGRDFGQERSPAHVLEPSRGNDTSRALMRWTRPPMFFANCAPADQSTASLALLQPGKIMGILRLGYRKAGYGKKTIFLRSTPPLMQLAP
jgi:hypothetical protein